MSNAIIVVKRSKVNTEYLEGHMKFKHSAVQNDAQQGSKCESTLANPNNTDAPSSMLENCTQGYRPLDAVQEAEAPRVNNENLANKQRGRTKRTSCTVEFKRKTLDLLDSLRSSRNKYNIVAKEKGVHRPLVQK